jgi:hypothetical protein
MAVLQFEHEITTGEVKSKYLSLSDNIGGKKGISKGDAFRDCGLGSGQKLHIVDSAGRITSAKFHPSHAALGKTW